MKKGTKKRKKGNTARRAKGKKLKPSSCQKKSLLKVKKINPLQPGQRNQAKHSSRGGKGVVSPPQAKQWKHTKKKKKPGAGKGGGKQKSCHGKKKSRAYTGRTGLDKTPEGKN